MSARYINGKWDLAKAKLKGEYPELTDADLAYEEGKASEMLERLERLLGKSPIHIAWLLEDVAC
jgi:hypothetical protein